MSRESKTAKICPTGPCSTAFDEPPLRVGETATGREGHDRAFHRETGEMVPVPAPLGAPLAAAGVEWNSAVWGCPFFRT